MASTTNENISSPTISSCLTSSIQLISNSPKEALKSLLELQKRSSSLHLFSKNETLPDIATSHIPLLSIEHHLGLALIASPTSTSTERHDNVIRAIDMFHAFLRTLDSMDALTPEIQKEYIHLMEMEDAGQHHEEDSYMHKKTRYLGESRDTKIARFQLKRAAEEEVSRLRALQDRRIRLSAEPEEEMDGYDDDGIQRICHIAGLHRWSVESIDEIYTALREMEMLKMAVEMEKQREIMNKHTGRNTSGTPNHNHPSSFRNPNNAPSNKPLEVTRITQDPSTGTLSFQKEQIQSQVFRPSWNQPTMSLQELADIEVAQAMERSERQQKSEEAGKMRPRRYDQLVRDGLEDHADLVDQSAELDRKWDLFKEENPRGSGNKNADRGDRNF